MIRRARITLIAAVAMLGSVAVRPAPQAPPPPSPARATVRFVDIAEAAGLRAVMVNGGEETKKYIFESTGSGIAAFDYDRDGFPDLLVVSGSSREGSDQQETPSHHLFGNNRDGTFRDVTRPAGLVRSGWGQGVCAADFDNDGDEDLLVTYFDAPNVFYRNNGKGTFREATREAGLETAARNWSSGCAFLDYNRDGHLDLFVARYVDFDLGTTPLPGAQANCLWKGVAVFCGPRGLPLAKNSLFRNTGRGTFEEVSEAAGIHHAEGCYGLGVLTADFENRGWTDIYVACDSTGSLLYRNNGDGTFTERGIEAGVAYNEDGLEQAGMGVSAGDFDGDGLLDILKTNFEGDVPSLYRNEGEGIFTFRTFDAKLGFNLKSLSWGGGFFDYDNDALEDVFIANGHVYPEAERNHHPESPYRQRNLLYRNLGNGTFEDVTSIAGPGLELSRSGRGVAFADIDNDGDVDIAVNNQNDPPTLLRNDGGNRDHWMAIRLMGTKSNRDGIGARIVLVAGGKRQVEEIRSGGSYLSQNDLRAHFGLGGSEKVDRLEVHWPSGRVDKMENVPADQFLIVEEGKMERKPR